MRITREPEIYDPPSTATRRLGRQVLIQWKAVGRAAMFTGMGFLYFRYMFSHRNRHEVFYQMFITGIRSLGVLTVVALFTGMIFALQTGLELARYGQEVHVGGAVTVVMLREMGPFMAGMILTASVGSSVGAQLGTMTVSEEVAALEIMSIDPIRFLVMPRLVAFTIMVPLCTFYTDIIAVLGGGLVGYTQFGIPPYLYYDNALIYAETKDLWIGILKAFVFGVIICSTACYQGFSTTGGAVGVGKSTRNTVVISFLLTLIVGYIITRLFYA